MDIRKFFGAPGGSKPKATEEEPAAKKAKTEDGTTAPGAGPSEPVKKSQSIGTTPAKTAPGDKPSKKTTPAAKPPSSKKQKKTRKLINSDSEDEEPDNGADSDFEIDLTGDGPDSSDDDDLLVKEEVDLAEDEEMEDAEKPSKGKKRTRKATEATPKSKSASQPTKSPATAKPTKPKTAAKSKAPAALAHIQDDPVAMAAVAAVDAAAEKLPPEESLSITMMPIGHQDRAPDEPINQGAKDAPRGHPDCLTGKTFVISGVLGSLTRPEAEDFIKRHGGKVTGAVSGRTSFLIAGKYTGNGKYNTAKDKGTKIIDEDGLFSLVRAAPAPEPPVVEQQQQQQQQGIQPVSAAGLTTVGKTGFYGAGTSAAGASGSGGGRPVAPQRPPVAPGSANGQLWVEKWRPKNASELVGNGATVNLFRHWLSEWDQVHLHGKAPTQPRGNTKKDILTLLKKKAVLLSGSPGIGKTSSALIIARELGYTPVEVNASDARGKADSSVLKGVGGKMSNAVKELATNTSVSYSINGQRKKLCLIMDEVDGMSAGDRGGTADLIQTIKISKIPIICICNDKYSTKLRSLRGHCMELDFRKPTVQQISKRMLEICAKEGLSMNQATMDALVQSANGGDIRLVLGQLQMIRLRAISLSYDQVRSGGDATAKDLEMSPFEAAKQLLDSEGSRLSLSDQIDLVFQDADLVPLLIQENYVNHRPRIAPDEATKLKVMAKAADGISAGDLLTKSVRQYQNWGLMPAANAVGSVYPAAYMRGMRQTFELYPGEQNFPRFTAWLGQNSSFGKQKRLLGELHTRMLSSGHMTADRSSLRLSYLPVLKKALSAPLRQKGKEGVEEVLKLMNEYCLSKDDLDYIMDVTKFKTKSNWGEDPFKPVEASVKSALTRAFNAQHVRPKTGFGMEEGKKKAKGRGRAAAVVGDDDEDAFGEEGVAQERPEAGPGDEEDEEELDPVLVRQKVMGLKHKGMELTLKDGSAAAKPAKGKGSRGGRGGGRGGAKAGTRGGRGGKK